MNSSSGERIMEASSGERIVELSSRPPEGGVKRTNEVLSPTLAPESKRQDLESDGDGADDGIAFQRSCMTQRTPEVARAEKS